MHCDDSTTFREAANVVDPDLQAYQRENALTGLSQRNTDKGLESISRPHARKRRLATLFAAVDSEDVKVESSARMGVDEDEEDESLAFAIQASLDQINRSKSSNAPSGSVALDDTMRTPEARTGSLPMAEGHEDLDDMYATPSGLSTALRFAHLAHSSTRKSSGSSPSKFGRPSLLMDNRLTNADSESDEDMEVVEINSNEPPRPLTGTPGVAIAAFEGTEATGIEVVVPASVSELLSKETSKSASQTTSLVSTGLLDKPTGPSQPTSTSISLAPTGLLDSDSPSQVSPLAVASQRAPTQEHLPLPMSLDPTGLLSSGSSPSQSAAFSSQQRAIAPTPPPVVQDESDSGSDMEFVFGKATGLTSPRPLATEDPTSTSSTSVTPAGQESAIPSGTTSRSTEASPASLSTPQDAPLEAHEDQEEQVAHEEEDAFDAANEIDVHAEEGEFARFLSQVKGRDLHQVRKEIDDEIHVLNQQKKAALRDAEDVNQQMVAQIMVWLPNPLSRHD